MCQECDRLREVVTDIVFREAKRLAEKFNSGLNLYK